MEGVRREMNTIPYDPSSRQVAQVLLSLSRLKGMRNRKALELISPLADKLDNVDSHEIFLSLARECNDSVDGHEESWSNSLRWLAECYDAGVQAVPFFDVRYPARLRNIDDPPVVLFVKGTLEALHGVRSVAIVGTRNPTTYGERAAQSAGKLAAESGIVVVSGLALGCDAKAHEGCVESHGAGVAVLAHGLDRVYPAANRDLADRILDCGGCLVSELPVGVQPTRWAFAYRDRIQSGLSDRVLVIETDVKGGTMHTVEFSRKQRRPLACIEHPASISSASQSKGNRMLIDKGTAVGIADPTALGRFLEGIDMPSVEGPKVEPKPATGQMSMRI